MPTYDEFPNHATSLISTCRSVTSVQTMVDLYRSVRPSSCLSMSWEHKVPASFGLGDSGLELPSMTLGTMNLSQSQAINVTQYALESGLCAIDTAPTYSNEDVLGTTIANHNDWYWIVKIPKTVSTAAQVRHEFDKSQSNLGKKVIDLLLLHWPCTVMAQDTVVPEVWKEMERLVQQGRVRALGVCNFNVPALLALLPHCTIAPVVNQVERHPLLPQWELVDFCQNQDIQLQAHTPLGQGKEALLEHEVIQDVAYQSGCSAVQVVLLWNLQQGVAVVPKCSTREHLEECVSVLASNDDCCAPRLTATHLQTLNTAITKERRFVAPPFMYGSAAYCWGTKMPLNK